MHGIVAGNRWSAASSLETSSAVVSGFQRKRATWRSTAALLGADRDPGQHRPFDLDRRRIIDALAFSLVDFVLLDLDLAPQQAEGLIPEATPQRDEHGIACPIREVARRRCWLGADGVQEV